MNSRGSGWKRITERATKNAKERIDTVTAKKQNRCTCEGCSFCFGEVGHPCGAATASFRCGWCR